MAGGHLVGKRVLLVEDEALIAMMLEEALGDLGCEVIGPVARLDAARQIIEAERFDCALIDIDLRGHPAYPLAELLDARGVPFGFVTGYAAGRVEPRFRRGHPVLQKPISADQLKAALTAMVRERPRPAPGKLPRRGAASQTGRA